MGIIAPISHRHIQEIIEKQETPLRRATFSSVEVDAVFRFGAIIGAEIVNHVSLQRGMDHARELIRQAETSGRSFSSGTVVLVGELTGGKGRFSREWFAPAGGLWLTLVLVNTLLPESTRLLPMAAGVAICELIRECGVDARIKWVNDVHVANRKIAGVLAETFIGPQLREEYVLVGIGININNDEFPPELAERAVSLKQISGTIHDLEEIAARLLAKLAWNYGLLCLEEQRLLAGREDDLDGAAGREHLLLARWQELSDSIGRRVRFGFDVEKAPQFEARALGIDPTGGLILGLDGQPGCLVEHAGEIVYLD